MYMFMQTVVTFRHGHRDLLFKFHSCISRVFVCGSVHPKKNSQVDMSEYWKFLIDGGYNLKLLIYSGDADSVCATSGTQTWIYDLGYPKTAEWTSWEVDEQVAGYITKFKGFTFLTVHNSGHEVPSYQPQVALEMLKRFLDNSLF